MPDLTPDPSLRRPPPPGARDAVTAAGRRRRVAALSGAALVLAVLVAVPVGLAARDGGVDRLVDERSPAATADPSAAPCPEVLDIDPGSPPTVPAPPTEGLEAALVPDEVPLAAVVCRYADSSAFAGTGTREPPEQVPLEGERPLTGGLEQLPFDLGVPAGSGGGFCTDIGGPLVPYLVRLTYPAGTVWVATRSDLNACEPVTNGAFTSAVYVGDQVAASYEAGGWVAAPPREGRPQGPCAFGPSGRAGQERQLVPAGWDSLTVCVQDGSGQAPVTVAPDRAEAIADLLDSLPTEPGGGFGASCDQRLAVPGDDDRPRFLRWSYPTGRDVVVIPFVGCDPPLANGSLSADATAEQQAELLRLLNDG